MLSGGYQYNLPIFLFLLGIQTLCMSHLPEVISGMGKKMVAVAGRHI